MNALDLLYLIAVICGCVAVWKHSRQCDRFLSLSTPLILLCGAVVSAGLFALGVTNDPSASTFECGMLYVSIDLMMALPILWTQHRICDTLVVVLFIGAWPFYFWGDKMMEPVTTMIASMQLFLTFPLPQWGVRLLVRVDRARRRSTPLELAVA